MDDCAVIIPTYNESKNIELIIRAIKKVAPKVRILVVDDSSPDGTSDIVLSIGKKDPSVGLLLRPKKEGLGKAYLHAFSELGKDSRIEWVVMMDADFSHDPDYLIPMLEAARTHDVIVGSRYVRGGDTEGWEPWRKMLSKYGNIYCRYITRMPVCDCTAGFSMIRKNFLTREKLQMLDLSGYAFQMELKYMLLKSGARFFEVPIVFKSRREGESKLSNHIIGEGILAPWKMIFKNKYR